LFFECCVTSWCAANALASAARRQLKRPLGPHASIRTRTGAAASPTKPPPSAAAAAAAAASPSADGGWRLPAAWGPDRAGTPRPAPSPPAATASPAKLPLPRAPAPALPAAKAPRGARLRASPGAALRAASAAGPQSRPLADLLAPPPPHARVPMAAVIHSMASLSRAGREPAGRKTNQDAVFAFRQYAGEHQAVAGVLDGHGPAGHGVSGFARAQLPALLAAQLRRRGDAAAPAALAAAFGEFQAALRAAAGVINARLSGSTAVVSLLQGRRLTTAWVGDSRAVLVRRLPGGPSAGVRGVALTRDHKPDCAGELARILAAGGRVDRLVSAGGRPVGPHRVWLKASWVPGLAMSRALGDFVAASVGVSGAPDVAAVDLDDADEWLILASDGVWEFIDVQEAAEAVAGCASAEDACRALVDAASAAWAALGEGVADDISVVAARLLPPGGGEGDGGAARLAAAEAAPAGGGEGGEGAAAP
jgi:serine/threonine protein phosphatase PrpC